MATSYGIPLGLGARPTTGAELAERLRATATASLVGLPVTGIDDASIVGELDGININSLSLDLSGASFDLPAGKDVAPEISVGAAGASELSRVPGTLRTATIQAHPALVAGAPVDLDARVAAVPIAWIERADGTAELAADDDLGDLSGEATITIAAADVPSVATAVINTALADIGASVSDVEVVLTSDEADAASLDATAKARYGMMSAGVRLRATLRIVDGRELQLSGLDLSTKNLLAGAVLALARGELEKLDGRSFDLVELLPAGVRNPRVHLRIVDGAVVVTAAVGEPTGS